MAARKAPRSSRSRQTGAAASATSRQLKQLRATVRELRAKLVQEAKKNRLDLRLLNQAKRVRGQISRQVAALREQGRKLAGELKKTLTEAGRRKKARDQALARIAELKAELVRKTEDLKRKSLELGQLARESAKRARTIWQSEQKEAGQAQPPAPAEPPAAGETQPTPAPTTSEDKGI